MRARSTIAVAVLSCALTVAGCANDPEPKEPAKTSPPTPVAAAPAMPDEARQPSKKGAVAFVKYYIDLLNHAANTGDVKPLKAASDPKCEGCNSYIELYEKTYAADGYFKDSGWEPREAKSVESSNGREIWITVDAPETEFRLEKNSKVERGESGVYRLYFEVTPGMKIGELKRASDQG